MKSNLGEVLRAKGDLEEAEIVLRGVIQEQQEAGTRDDQVCLLSDVCRFFVGNAPSA